MFYQFGSGGPAYNYANGHDTSTFTFDKTGGAGTFEITGYTYGYADQTAVTSNDYTKKSWYQNSGYKGTFTYDAKTMQLVTSITDFYEPKSTASPMTNGSYAAADYAYESYTDLVSAQNGGATVTGASVSTTMQVALTQDSAKYVCCRLGRKYLGEHPGLIHGRHHCRNCQQ
jgi:hypothetical protein